MQLQVVQEPNPLSDRIADAKFAFVICQHGAEDPLKQAFLAEDSHLSLAFSRPGLVTFKFKSTSKQLPRHLLARLSGWSIGQLRSQSDAEGDAAKTAESLVHEALQLAGRGWDAIHVFERDHGIPGQAGFEPGTTPLAASVAELFRQSFSPVGNPSAQSPLTDATPHFDLNSATIPAINQVVDAGSRVLDVVLIEPDQWLLGCHLATERYECWPGGVYPQPMQGEVISRAYYKMAEAIAWSGLPIRAGDTIVELGSSPGGACQRLLDLGLQVTGVDPAEMDPQLLSHPRFEHWRSKSAGLKRKWFNKFRWLAADANVAPNYTLDMVQDIVTYPGNNIEGMLLTFKLTSYDLIDDLPKLFDRIRGWGYSNIDARQLASNRQECIVSARR